MCECGCGQPVAWRGASFQRLVHGHVTAAMRLAAAARRKGKVMAQQQRVLISKKTRELFATERGHAIAKKRAESLRRWHASPEGRDANRLRGDHMRVFNATTEGRAARVAAGKKVSQWRREHPMEMARMAEKLRAWYVEAPGQEMLERRSALMREFYASEAGRAAAERVAAVLRRRNRLTQDEFQLKLQRAFKKLEPVDASLVPAYEDYVGYRETFTRDLEVRCKDCGATHLRSLINVINVPKCMTCDALISAPQREVAGYIRSLGFDVVDCARRVLSCGEVDVWVPSARFGIEFNGLYWHCDLNREDRRHVERKHADALSRGVRLFTIFEDEWRDRRPIVEGMIRHRLGLSTRVGARTLGLCELSMQERKAFFEHAHVDGDVRADVAFGLRDPEGRIIQALSLRTPFHSSLVSFSEVARSATLPGRCVVGGLSRLITRACFWAREAGKCGLLTYVDGRYGDGASYEASGFVRVRRTGPRFWWTDFRQRHDRFMFRAKDGITQSEVAAAAGMHMIWGAGNIVLERRF